MAYLKRRPNFSTSSSRKIEWKVSNRAFDNLLGENRALHEIERERKEKRGRGESIFEREDGFLDGFQLTLGYSTHDRVYIQFPWPIKMKSRCLWRTCLCAGAYGWEGKRRREKEGQTRKHGNKKASFEAKQSVPPRFSAWFAPSSGTERYPRGTRPRRNFNSCLNDEWNAHKTAGISILSPPRLSCYNKINFLLPAITVYAVINTLVSLPLRDEGSRSYQVLKDSRTE